MIINKWVDVEQFNQEGRSGSKGGEGGAVAVAGGGGGGGGGGGAGASSGGASTPTADGPQVKRAKFAPHAPVPAVNGLNE